MSKKIWVIVESKEGKAHPVSWELLGKARELAGPEDELGAVVVGYKIDSVAQEALEYGATRVYVLDAPVFAYYRNLPFREAIVQLAKKYTPDIILLGATTLGRDLGSAVATSLETGLTADATELALDEKGHLLATRPAFGGNIMATISWPEHKPQMSTVRPRVFPLPQKVATPQGEVIQENIELKEEDIPVKRLEFIPKEKGVNLEYAEVIVAGGKGIAEKKDFELLFELAKLLGGEVGASRAAVDAGFIGYEHQIGQTGKTVRPKVYLGFGISGAVQHRVGMQESDYIIAVNQDPLAQIFSIADLGLVGDLYQILPSLLKRIKELKES
ncbi:MAG: Electron transfer flavoprotein alpha subunit [Desulfonauticus sp. 38_4375]|nr:MAG: Electron transfer flavoprotein alpha subunit [Desulfonauticus sp. 38_4375]